MKITSLLLALILCFSLFSCNADSNGATAAESEQIQETLPRF